MWLGLLGNYVFSIFTVITLWVWHPLVHVKYICSMIMGVRNRSLRLDSISSWLLHYVLLFWSYCDVTVSILTVIVSNIIFRIDSLLRDNSVYQLQLFNGVNYQRSQNLSVLSMFWWTSCCQFGIYPFPNMFRSPKIF